MSGPSRGYGGVRDRSRLSYWEVGRGGGLVTAHTPKLRPVLRLLNNKLARPHGASQHDHTGLYRVSSGVGLADMESKRGAV